MNIRSSSNIRVDVRQCQIYCVLCALVLHFYFFCAVCILLNSVVGSCVALQEVERTAENHEEHDSAEIQAISKKIYWMSVRYR